MSEKSKPRMTFEQIKKELEDPDIDTIRKMLLIKYIEKLQRRESKMKHFGMKSKPPDIGEIDDIMFTAEDFDMMDETEPTTSQNPKAINNSLMDRLDGERHMRTHTKPQHFVPPFVNGF
jgi:hypothetical protein